MVIDTLEILIEADRSGLESQLKRAITAVTSFVSSMNKQEVNWQMIMARTISPAVISGIAAMFALAITRVLSFNDALMKSAAGATDVFSENIGEMSESARSLAIGTTISTEDTAKGLALLSKTSFDSAVQMIIASQSTKLAELRGLDYVTTIMNMIDVLKAWNINTVPAAVKAFDYLNSAQKNSAFTWDEFVKMVVDAGPLLRKATTFTDAVEGLAAFSMQAGFTRGTVVSVMAAITKAINDPREALNYLNATGKQISTLIEERGIVAAFEAVADAIRNRSLVAAIALGEMWGLNKEAVMELRSASVTAFDEIKQRQIDNIMYMKSLNEEFEKGVSETDQIKRAWNEFKTAFTDPRIVDFVKEFINLLLGMGTTIAGVVHPIKTLQGLFTGINELVKSISAKGLWEGLKSSVEDVAASWAGIKPAEETLLTPEAQRRLLAKETAARRAEVELEIPGTQFTTQPTKAGKPVPTPTVTPPSVMGAPGQGVVFTNYFNIMGGGEESARQILRILQQQYHAG